MNTCRVTGFFLLISSIISIPGGPAPPLPVQSLEVPATAFFQPGVGQVLGAVALVGAGLAATLLIDRLGGKTGGANPPEAG